MSSQMWCAECAKNKQSGTRKVLEASTTEGYYEPAEYERVVWGIARKPLPRQRIVVINDVSYPLSTDYWICDNCNREIKPGTQAATWTVWADGMAEPPAWEEEFLVFDNLIAKVTND